ncbi:ribonuclease H-like domain-containing protein [Halovenus marina]|uniref:ribonuclease H-like domain-containing protein n=1 Tax=Halovenus marina TaxID=3396621 RepID=UPI003F572059
MQITDSLEYFSPDVVLVPSDRFRYELTTLVSNSTEVISLDSHHSKLRHISTVRGVELLVAPTIDALSSLSEYEREHPAKTVSDTYLLSDILELDVKPTRLETRLVGCDQYETRFADDNLERSFTHLTPNANPGYRQTWGTLHVQGVMPGVNITHSNSGPQIAHLSLLPDGVVSARTRMASQFGVRALNQVGQTRCETLREAGFRFPEEIADAELSRLMDISGFGRSTAKTIVDAAEAFVAGEVRRTGDGTLPGGDPIFIDIETDGLNPTIVWLIGVLDRQGDERYLSFLNTDPNNPGDAVESFMSWLDAYGHNRPVVAYNGYEFDFPIIEEHVNRYCPEHLELWEDTWKFDPYRWAVSEGKALLPGRTNKLDDVAQALGWTSEETGLTGETVARLFQAYMENPSPETELDWERHERYCEDDVRALAYVYDALDDASTRANSEATSSGESQSRKSSNTAQGRLTDF